MELSYTRRAGLSNNGYAAYGIETRPAAHTTAPLIAGCASSIECRVVESMELADRTVFIAQMLALHLNDGYRPLISFQHRFHELAGPLPIPLGRPPATPSSQKTTSERRPRKTAPVPWTASW